MIDDETKAALDAEIDPARVRSDSDIAHGAAYLEAHDVIAAANRIFGYDGWSFELLEVIPVSAASRDGESRGVLYMARGRLTVGETVRVDVGTNDVSYRGKDGNATPDAFETAIKGAVSDALKRCFRTWGNQFGNSLYQKDRPQQRQRQQPQRPAAPAAAPNAAAKIPVCKEHEVPYDVVSPTTGKRAHALPDEHWCIGDFGRFTSADDPLHAFVRQACGHFQIKAADILAIAKVERAAQLPGVVGGLDAVWAAIEASRQRPPLLAEDAVKTASDLVTYAAGHGISETELFSILGLRTIAEIASEYPKREGLLRAIAHVNAARRGRPGAETANGVSAPPRDARPASRS